MQWTPKDFEPLRTGPQDKAVGGVVRHRMRRAADRQRGQGFSVVGMAIAFALMTMAAGLLMSQRYAALQQDKASHAAKMLATLTVASGQYLSSEATTLSNDLQLGGAPIAIPITNSEGFSAPNGLPSLQTAGFVAPAFRDVDPFYQEHALLVREVAPTSSTGNTPTYQALLVSFPEADITSGSNLCPSYTSFHNDPSCLSPAILGSIIQQSDGSGGFIPPSDPSHIDGAYGTWTTSVNEWNTNTTAAGESIPVSPGAYMATLQFQPAANTISSYLDRYAASNPDLNTMHTDILMAGNSVQSASGYGFSNGGSIVGTSSSQIQISPTASGNSGLLSVNGSLLTNGDLSTTGDATITGQVSANSVSAASANVVGNLQVGNQVTSLGNMTVGGSLTVAGNAVVSGSVNAANVDTGTLTAQTASFNALNVTNNANVTGTVAGNAIIPTGIVSIGQGCSNPGQIAYTTSGVEAFCSNTAGGTQFVAWDGGAEVSVADPVIHYAATGAGYVATLSTASGACLPGQQTAIQTSQSSNTPPPGYSPTSDLGFVCGEDGVWQPIRMP